jgi:hypothetical protein
LSKTPFAECAAQYKIPIAQAQSAGITQETFRGITSREARALDVEAGLGSNPARILELVDYESVSAGWERLNGRHGRDLYLD